jgi:hypothetical protein
MLIKIDSSVVNNEDQSTWEQETVNALELLALARREGKHALIGDRKTLKTISQCTDLSRNARQIYNKLSFENTQQFEAYRAVVTRYIEIINPCTVPQLFNYSGKQVIKVPPKFFNDSAKVQQTVLLCENEQDAIFYEKIARVYLVWKDMKFIQLKYSPRGGGGSSIAPQYARIQEEKQNICLCIADSDKIAPNGDLGETAKQIKDDPKCIITELFILDLHEIENLIPNSILNNLCSGNNSDRQKALAILEAIEKSPVKDLRKFLDIKNGTRLEKIVNTKNSGVKDYWKEKLSEIPDISNRIDTWCQNSWSCGGNGKKDKKDKCSNCNISLGFGHDILDHAINDLCKKEPAHISTIVDQDMRLEWEKVGEVVLNWCCAASPMLGI